QLVGAGQEMFHGHRSERARQPEPPIECAGSRAEVRPRCARTPGVRLIYGRADVLQRGRLGMLCPRCRHDNPTGSKFCLGCGARLGRTCASCGGDLPVGARFCNNCGVRVSADAAPQPQYATPEAYTPLYLADKILRSKGALEGERKQVTVLFADLKG